MEGAAMAVVITRLALVHGGRQADRVACHLFRLRDADGDRLCDSGHPIERLNGDCDFSLLSCERAGTQARTDDALVAADRGLDETTTAVAGCLLSSHPTLLRNGADMAVALTRSVVA